MTNTLNTVLSCQNLVKEYAQGQQKLRVLDGVNLSIQAGETVAIVGSSGAGKSTLLNLLGGLDLPSSGDVVLMGEKLTQQSEQARGRLRNQFMGFVYQFHHLLPEFSALENVEIPLLIGKQSRKTAQARATQMLARVGLDQRLRHKPAQLSGGERQRVAIARALVTDPRCVFMDEPTGNLDARTAQAIEQLIHQLNQELSTSFVVVTHDDKLAQSMDRVLYLADGRLQPQLGGQP